ncbi:glucose-1-phosphate cytidylyltransferase [Roseibium sp. MMSF_3544]|uniref:glucose-1-phosphate cytidylyltransferase n=1 Tax=unclassified Roseibium TaxID=2629323 RepID=UPI00274010AE|nr:glucose-1-phosphate cytidylyltransferase [Roseibium sp. MMSF_3544]
MKAVILAGGLGTRLAEETVARPKPMVEIGGKPILWHIMKMYSAHGINEFIICLGYKGYMIKEFFANYLMHVSNVTIDLKNGGVELLENRSEPWKITLIETGLNTQTAGRIKKILPFVGDDDFCMTYGDGLSDIDITESIAFHRKESRLATVTAVRLPGRFGAVEIEDTKVSGFVEKPRGESGWINGGFFVLSPKIEAYLQAPDIEDTPWEQAPMKRISHDGQMSAFVHEGFWQPMDTLREKQYLENLWQSGDAPWKVWRDIR